jgi:hypothetical protein
MQWAPYAEHSVPQVPQLLVSEVRSAQLKPQYVSPCEHVHEPFTQDEPPEHTWLQAPQFQLSVCEFTQDSKQ